MCARNSNFGTPKSGPVETRPILLVATALLCNYSTQQTAKTTTLFLQWQVKGYTATDVVRDSTEDTVQARPVRANSGAPLLRACVPRHSGLFRGLGSGSGPVQSIP